MRVVMDLEDERKHVAALEGQLKEANNGTTLPSVQTKDGSSQTIALGPDIQGNGAVAKVALLEDELALIVRENENLKSQVSRIGDKRGGACMPTCLAEAPKLELKEIDGLKRDLEEAQKRLLEIQQAKDLAEQVTDSCVMEHTPHDTRQADVLSDMFTADFHYLDAIASRRPTMVSTLRR